MKIAYAGFDLLYPALKSFYNLNCEIVKIFSCKVDNITEFNKEVCAFAKKHDIPITFDKITLEDLKALKNEGVDALICGAYYYRIPILPDFKMVNIHPSLLPIGRGAWPMPLTILNNMKQSGVTFHKMEESFDTGDILLQESFNLSDNENLNSFMQKIYALLPDMVEKLVCDFSYYYDNAKAQGDGEYWEAPNERDYIITKDTDFETADRILRAFSGFYVLYNDGEREFSLLNAKAIAGDNKNQFFKINGGYIIEEKS
ncbi:MAG: hypothetical protein IJD68_00500 [Ruminococcus sp.]|nr:hypothetical protein [Ruminococcus sp.]